MFLSRIINKIVIKYRYQRNKKLFGTCDGFVNIGDNVTINNHGFIHFFGDVSIGKYTYISPVVKYAGIDYNPKISFGGGCIIGVRNSFASVSEIRIGKNVLFAGYVHITDHSHGYEDIDQPITPQKLTTKGPVIIEDDCWLGFGCEILSGVHIGKHCVVAARAVVTKNVPPYSIVAGNPARIIKKYNIESKQWQRI